MATNFPELHPTARTYRAPTWPTSGVRSQSGVGSKRLWGSLPTRAALSLEFANIGDTETAQILDAYKNAKGPCDSLNVPSIVFSGMSEAVIAEIDADTNLWYFGNAPRVQSVVRGVSTVRVDLQADIRS